MRLSIKDLEDLVVAIDQNADYQLERIYEWDHQLQMSGATWLLGLATSLLVGLLLASLSAVQPTNKNTLETIGAVFGGAASLAIGGWWLSRIRNTYSEYIATLSLLVQLREIRTFLIRYRNDPNRPWI
jgi:hypothetical protein